jgi:hypothetical protein
MSAGMRYRVLRRYTLLYDVSLPKTHPDIVGAKRDAVVDMVRKRPRMKPAESLFFVYRSRKISKQKRTTGAMIVCTTKNTKRKPTFEEYANPSEAMRSKHTAMSAV